MASGDLKGKPLPHLLVFAVEQRLTGTLSLTDELGFVGDVYFNQGVPMKVVARLAADHPVRFAPPQAQAELKLLELFRLPSETRFAFFDRFDSIGDPGHPPSPLSVWNVLWRGLRDYPDHHAELDVLGRVMTEQFLLVPGAPLERLCLELDEASQVQKLSVEPQTIDSFMALGIVPPPRARSLFYCLLITRCLRVYREDAKLSRSMSGRGMAAVTPPAIRRPSGEMRAPTVVPASVGKATISITPRRSSAPPPGVRGSGAMAFEGVEFGGDENVSIDLADPKIPGPPGAVKAAPPRKPSSSQRSMDELAVAKESLIMHMYADAASFARTYLSKHEGHCEAEAVMLYAEAQRPDPKMGERARKAIDMISRIIFRDEHCAPAYYYRALLLQRIGEHAKAFHDLRVVIKLDPKNADAAREVRSYGLRGIPGITDASRNSEAPPTSAKLGAQRLTDKTPKK